MKHLYLLIFIHFSLVSSSQNLSFYKSQIDTLCSETMYGRGYLNDGHSLAADYIEQEFEKQDLVVVQQNFPLSVNVFPEVSKMEINDSISLTVGQDFIPSPISGSISGVFDVLWLDSVWLQVTDKSSFIAQDLSNTVLVYHDEVAKSIAKLSQQLQAKINTSAGVITLKKGPLMGSFYNRAATNARIDMLSSSFPTHTKSIKLTLRNEIKSIVSQNVIASPKKIAKKLPTILVTAHYDHLGGYGADCFVSGANDNASGVAMILNMAQYFKNNPVKANVIFIAFGGEEVGLLGSSYYVSHPIFPLKKVDLVLNFDLMGAGSKGVMIENGTDLPEVYQAFVTQNKSGSYVPVVKKRGNSANSDHYPFTQKSVKAVFIYSLGEVGGYHNTLDAKEELEYESYPNLFEFMIKTIERQLIK